MLRNGEANPLTVHGLRELDHCPPHFVQVKFNLTNNRKQVSDWIWEHLEGRFWFGDWFDINESGQCIMTTCAAFELPGEASMFTLCLDQIQTNNYQNLL